MSDGTAAGEGGGGGGGAPAGGSGAPAGGAPAGGGGAPAAYYEAFTDATLKTHPSIHLHKTPEDLARSYVNLEKRFGLPPERLLELPAKPDDAEGWKAVWSKLGAPEAVEGYGFQHAEGATDADKALLDGFGKFAHENGFPKGFAQKAVEFWTQQAAAAREAGERQLTERRTAGESALKTEFGAAFDSRMGEVERFLQTYDKEGKTGLNKENLVMFPEVTKMLASVINRMAEPGGPGGQSGDGARGQGELTPAQATAQRLQLEKDHAEALQNKNHAQHQWAVKERTRLLYLADGKNPPA